MKDIRYLDPYFCERRERVKDGYTKTFFRAIWFINELGVAPIHELILKSHSH